MARRADVLLISVLVVSSLTAVHAQDGKTTVNGTRELKTLIVAPEATSDSVIAVPPATSEKVSLRGWKHAKTFNLDLTKWLREESGLNGLQSSDAQPWHVMITYDQFDEDGDNIRSGTFEEFWAGPKKYKRIYKSDNFNQTDYATDHGLFRVGDQRWPDSAELQVRTEVIDPFSFAATLHGFRAGTVERTFGAYKLQCVQIEKDSVIVSDPTQYCFEPDSSVLRYTHGSGWFQTAYNRIVTFQGRNVAQDVDVTDGGKPYLKLRVEAIELISHVDEADFAPPSDAVGPIGERISGVLPTLIKASYPEWPPSLRGQHFCVVVEIVIGENGHVVSAHAVSGPQEGRKACEDAVRKSLFAPYSVLDKPVEVETKFECSHQ